MKKLILLFILFFGFSNLAFSQAYYQMDITGYVGDGGKNCGTVRGLEFIEITYANGQINHYFNPRVYENRAIVTPSVVFHESNRITRIRFHTNQRYKNFGCKSRRKDGYVHVNSGCFNLDYNFSRFNSDVHGNAIINIRPIIQLTSPEANNIFGSNDLFSTTPVSGDINNSFYNWEYSINNGSSWQLLPNSTQNKNYISILGNAFLSDTDHGRNIDFRVNTGCSTSNIIRYNHRLSAPHISSIDTKSVACFEDINGSIKINFDRALRTGESFSISIEDLDDQTGTVKGIPVYETVQSASNITLEPDNSFTFNESIGKPLPPGNFRIKLLGFINGFSTYIEGINHTKDFTITEPTPVEFSLSKVDVWCHGGSDGEISISANGGTGNYEYQLDGGNWEVFSNGGIHTMKGLLPETYKLKVRDSNGCIAKEIVRDGGGLGEPITETIEITEPDNPVAVAFVFSVEPTAFGFSDGRIRAQITGGTPLGDGRYNYTWTHSNGTTWTTFTDEVTKDGWFLTLENAIVGTYKLTVTDANYDEATNRTGCTIIEEVFTLEEPPLLELSLAETSPVSCHNTNTFNDPWSDGELTAIVSGGVPLKPTDNNGLKYYYTWKKETSPGIWKELVTQTTNVATGLDLGNYAVNIIDANDIIIGTYTNNVLVTPTDELYTLNQPNLLQIALTKVDVFCNQGNDGSIDATITGGTGNYTIHWNNGATTEDIDTLIAGTYTINVTDEKGCQAKETITINEPDDPLEINYVFFEPTFASATNGWIEATVTGGTPLDTGAYTYVWKDSDGTSLNSQVTQTINATSYVIKLNDIGAGIYDLKIEDKNHPLAINKENCTIKTSKYELKEPEPLTAKIQLATPISCNSSNTYNDPSSDGALEIFAEGGVKLQESDNNGLDYYYTWRKETNPGVWTILTNQTTNIASGLDAGNYAVNIEDANGIILGVYNSDNELETPTDVSFLFEEPPLLKLSIEKQDVYCYNGSDSWAKAIISGGTLPYDILWSNGDTDQQTSSLSQGLYTVEITDARGCQVSGSIQINQPTEAISIEYTAFATPSVGNATDGWIEAQIKGGTDFTDGSYTYYWQDEAGSDLNTQTTTSIVNGVFQIRLNTIPKGKYYLTIEDANFPSATTGNGCTVIDEEFILYDPIEATISLHTPISCHQNNVFNDPFSDGKLQVKVTGGLPFDTENPYIYYWKKENTSGIFEDLNQNSEIATGLSHGNYALNVEDSRGVVIGVYESLNLRNATDETFNFIEPDLLEVSLTATEISCGAGNDATATVAITGGTAPYTIQWSNGQDLATATNLIAGNYVVYVTDARGCQAIGKIAIDQPGGLQINVIAQTNPTCFDGADGKITLEISGGVLPYTYSWNTGATATSIDNLLQGTYRISLTDANGCIAFKEIVLKNPDKIVIDLGEDRTLCKDQSQDLEGSINDANATYLWTSNNGFTATTPQITVSEAGTYQITATSSLGCVAKDTIVISYNDTEIDSEFLLSSQAYQNQDVILFNVSRPIGETSQWLLPPDVTIVSETTTSITLRFSEVNTYKIGLISTQGDCYKEIYKNIVVEKSSGLVAPGDAEAPFIEEFTLTPNPNNGQFELYIDLAKSSPIAIRVYSIQGSIVLNKTDAPTAEEYTIPISLTLPSGVYVVVLETAKQTQVKRMIVD